jgi:beta-carotene ketolase (CrtW type)
MGMSDESTDFVLSDMGFLIAIVIIGLWAAHLTWCLVIAPFQPTQIHAWLHVAVQGFLYTGLFITAHDAMHGTVVRGRTGNTIIGSIAAFLFAGMSYKRLYVNHHRHHAHPADDHDDPDYHPSNSFLRWLGSFMWRYTTIPQLVVMGALYNVLAHVAHLPEWRLWMFWILPAMLGTLQLFYVGTYRPHRKPHTADMPHHARTMRKNHVMAFLACYFFGYHSEHHLWPGTPWWKLWMRK